MNGNNADVDPVLMGELQGKIAQAREGLRVSVTEVEA